MSPPTVKKKTPGRPQKSFFSEVQECTDPCISKSLTSYALAKTEPVGDDLQSTALRSTQDDDDDVDDNDISINSLSS